MLQKDKTYLFETASIPSAMTSLCVPTVLSSLVMACYSLADTYFVGLLNDPVQNAAVTLASPALMIFDCFVALFGIGCASMMSRALGRKDLETVRGSSAVGVYLALVFGILLSIVFTVNKETVLQFLGADNTTRELTGAYLKWTFTCGAMPYILHMTMANMIRAEGSTQQASIGIISGCILNIVLDPFFVLPFGLDMGVAGAGCATFLSHCFSCIYFFAFLIKNRDRTYVNIDPRGFSPTKEIMKEMSGVGIPAMINKFLTVSSQVVLNKALAQYGANAVAAMGVAFRIDVIPLDVCIGISQGIMPLIGYNYASGDHKRMKEAWGYTAKITSGFMICVVMVYLLIPHKLVGLFIENAEVIRIGSAFLRGMCLALPLYGFTTIAIGAFQACGLGGYSLTISLSRQLLLMIPSILILDRLFGMYGIAYSYLTAEMVLVVVLGFLMKRLFSDLDNGKIKKAA